MRRLASVDLPTPLDKADVVAEFDRWVEANLPDGSGPILLLGAFGRQPLTVREQALEDLLYLLLGSMEAWSRKYDCGSLARNFDRIVRELAPVPAVMSYLKDEAEAFVAAGLDRLRGEPDRLVAFLGGTRLEATSDAIVLPALDASVALDDIFPLFVEDALALYRLRATLWNAADAFDLALIAHRDILAPALEAGVLRLFERDAPAPADYFAAFGPMLREERWFPKLMEQIAIRSEHSEGFHGTPPGEWLRVLCEVRAWTPDDLRRLVRIEPLFSSNPDLFGKAAVAGARALQQEQPGAAVFGALSFLLLVRRQRTSNARMIDVEVEEDARRLVGELSLGAEILNLHDRLGSLPVDVRGERCKWTYLAKGEKGLWRWRVRSSVERSPALCEGLAEFLLAWTSRDVYADVVTLVEDVLSADEELSFLRMLAASRDEIVSLRAGCLAREIPFDVPVSA